MTGSLPDLISEKTRSSDQSATIDEVADRSQPSRTQETVIEETHDRRQFLTTALASCAGLALSSPMFAQTSASAPTLTVDTPRELKPAGADLGTLYQDMLALCADRPFDMSFLGDRFATLPEFLQIARQQVFETLQYRPSAVAPNAEVLERADMGDYIREKIL
ncbi:MAG: hypothetical protein IT423_07450, partial [Pirellulaceae bacterium]|nr:hypothetical protein [Pirellulaceae bacterium]